MPARPVRARQMALRTYLVLLMVGSMLPFLLVSGALLQRVLRDNRLTVERTLVDSAHRQATELDAELDATIRTLQALTTSSLLERGDLEGYETLLRRVVVTQPWLSIRVLSADGQLMLDTEARAGKPPNPVVDPDSLARVRATRKPAVANLRRSPAGVLAFAVRVPIVIGGELRYVLTALITPERVAAAIGRETARPNEWTRVVVDRAGTVVTRTRNPERFVGTPATDTYMARVTASTEGFYQDTSLEGQQVYVAFSRSSISGWTSAVVVPASAMDAPLRQSMAALSGMALLVLLLSGSGAYWLAGRISSDIGSATLAAEALAQGHPVHTGPSIVGDITRLAQALERSASLLAERSTERDRNLAQAEAARAEAEEANLAKDQFLAMLGHELRNPLSPIVTALALLKMRGAPWTREHAVIERQVNHVSRLVNDLLDVSRITRRTLDLRKSPLRLADVITRATDIASPLLEERRQKLTVDVPAHLRVVGDEVRLAQVFGNLLANAAAYTPEGGSVSVRATQHGDSIAIDVSDTGRGIAPEMAPRIFDLFVQGPRTIDRREGGLGLGLAIARSLVDLHDGHIEARSAGVGRGSTFTVRLPAAPETAQERPTVAPEPPTTPPLDILLVDDNADAAEMLSMLLTAQGHRVMTASDGPQALDRLTHAWPDVAILDIGLPVMDGYELARRIRDTPGNNPPRLIALTGYGQEEDLERSRQAGFAHHLVKPVDADELLRLIVSTADNLPG
ncbi:MAG: ATP-binding protein [Vicinamibacterales bacterium]